MEFFIPSMDDPLISPQYHKYKGRRTQLLDQIPKRNQRNQWPTDGARDPATPSPKIENPPLMDWKKGEVQVWDIIMHNPELITQWNGLSETYSFLF